MSRLRGRAIVALLLGVISLAGCSGTPAPPVPAGGAAAAAGQGSVSPPGAGSAPSFPAHPLEASAARSMETALASSDEHQLRTVLSVPPTQSLDPALAAGLQAVAPLIVEERTFHQIDGQSATVTVRTGGKSPQSWSTTLLLEGGSWKVALTDQAGS